MLGYLFLGLLLAGHAAGQNASHYISYIEDSSDEVEFLRNRTIRLFRDEVDLFNIERIRQILDDRKANTSDSCAKDFQALFTGLRETSLWAYKILDASGSYSSGYLFGNRFWLGSETECVDLINENKDNKPPFPVKFYIAKYQVSHNITSHHQTILLGICLPASCTTNELAQLLDSSKPLASEFKSVRAVPNDNYQLLLEPAAFVLVVVVAIGVLMIIVGTLYEIFLERRAHVTLRSNRELAQGSNQTGKGSTNPLEFYGKGENVTAATLSSAESTVSVHSGSSCDSNQHRPGTPGQILLCFSLKRNIKKICDTRGTDALGCVHGLRVFSLLWVIAGHTCMITVPFVDNIGFRLVVERDFLFQSISNGAFSVDTFFFISGLLIAYVFGKAEKEKQSETLSAAKHASVTSLKLIGGFTYRFIRLTPPYAFIMVCSYLMAKWFLHNSVYDPPMGDFATCPQYWWRNLLYINTLFPVDQMCVIWSWYLADDTQFYVLGLLMLLLSTRYAKSVTVASIILLLSSWITTAVITLQTNHKPRIEEPLGLFDQLYDKPWTRLGPYVVGMAVGYYLAKVNCQATFRKSVVALGWFLSLATTFVLVHGLYGRLTQLESAAYVALSHTAWALALSWIVVACVTGYGGPVNSILSAKIFPPLSRLTYCAYLIHPLIMISALTHMDGPAHLQRDTIIIAIFGYFFVSYLGSVVLTLLLEAPTVTLLNIFHPLKKKIK